MSRSSASASSLTRRRRGRPPPTRLLVPPLVAVAVVVVVVVGVLGRVCGAVARVVAHQRVLPCDVVAVAFAGSRRVRVRARE